jgi:hypothetical protein
MSTVIEVVIDEEGNIVSTTKGFVGGQCLKAQESIKATLKEHGIEATTTAKTLTAEAQQCQKAQQKTGGC